MNEASDIYYHFCDFSIYELENIANQQLYFSPISSFNDPEDSHLRIDSEKMLKQKDLRHYLFNLGVKEDRFGLFLHQVATGIEQCLYVASFSKMTDPNLPTMWGYYGGKSKGMRLAFDFSLFRPQKGCLDLETSLIRVRYERTNDQVVAISDRLVAALLRENDQGGKASAKSFFSRLPLLLAKIEPRFHEDICACVSEKLPCWAPEKEYRLVRILSPRRRPFLKYQNRSFLHEIALGPSAGASQVQLVKTLCAGLDPKHYIEEYDQETKTRVLLRRGARIHEKE